MGVQHDQTERIEALRGLIERLSAPDLTLAEAKVLRGQVSVLLACDNRTAGGDPMVSCPVSVPSHDVGDGPRRNNWSPVTSIRAAG